MYTIKTHYRKSKSLVPRFFFNLVYIKSFTIKKDTVKLSTGWREKWWTIERITFFFYKNYSCMNKMEDYCGVCDRTIQVRSKSKHFQTLTHNELEKRIGTKQTVQNPEPFNINSIFNEYIR